MTKERREWTKKQLYRYRPMKSALSVIEIDLSLPIDAQRRQELTEQQSEYTRIISGIETLQSDLRQGGEAQRRLALILDMHFIKWFSWQFVIQELHIGKTVYYKLVERLVFLASEYMAH